MLKPTFSILLVHCVSAEACTLLQALRWSQKHQQVCHFFFLLSQDCRCSCYFTLSGISGRNYPFFPPPFLSGYKESLVTHFFHVMIRPMSCAATTIYSPMKSLSSHTHSSLFTNWRLIVSSKLFDTQILLVTTEELVLPVVVVT